MRLTPEGAVKLREMYRSTMDGMFHKLIIYDIADFVEDTGISPKYLDEYLNGKREFIEDRHVKGFAVFFGTTVEDLERILSK